MERGRVVYKNYIDLLRNEHNEILSKRNFYKKYSLDKEKEISLKQHLDYVEKLKAIKDKIYYAIYLEDKLAFSINIQEINIKNKSSYWGFFKISDVDVTYILQEFISFYFKTLKLNILYALINIENKKSIELHEKLGFKLIEKNDKTYKYMLKGKYE